MTTTEVALAAAPQTPAQWAVRWFAVVAIGALFASAPIAHVVWHGLLGRDEVLLPLRTQTKAPTPSVAAMPCTGGPMTNAARGPPTCGS